MKVSDIMQKNVDWVGVDARVEEVCHLIFGRGINGVPVVKGKKLVGFVTDRDILSKFLPSMHEYMENLMHVSDFEERERQVEDILSLPVEDIMSTSPITTSADTPILQAQSLMFAKRVGRLPVIDNKKELIGIVSRGDIFRAIVGKKLPLDSEERFYDRLAAHYDVMIEWRKRLPREIADLDKLFKKEKVEKILDVASGTGEHAIALTQKGFEVIGVESSSLMYKQSIQKRENLSDSLKKRVHLFTGIYEEMLATLQSDFDAAVFLGNSFPYVLHTDRRILHDTVKVLKNKSFLVFQVSNFHKILANNDGLRTFEIRVSPKTGHKHAYVGFYTKDNKNILTYHFSVFSFDNKKWTFDGISSTPLLNIGEKEIKELLKKLGFSNIKLYGGMLDGPLFQKPFDKDKSQWLNVIAKR